MHPSSQKFLKIVEDLENLHLKKAQDYGTEEDPFSNIRGSVEFGVPAYIGSLIRLNDKVKRLQAFVNNGKLVNESAQDSLMDLASYAIITLILLEETENE